MSKVEWQHTNDQVAREAQLARSPVVAARRVRQLLPTLGGSAYDPSQKGQDVLHPEASAQVWGFFDVKD
jgi:hypothetical protein